METKEQSLIPLSASRIKTYENCSFLYYCQYILKLPQETNEGAKLGNICHKIFQVLLNPRHLKHYNFIVKVNSIEGSKATKRLLIKLMASESVKTTSENINKLDSFILTGLLNDFFVKDGTLIKSEFKFDILSQSPRYRIKGFMDKPFLKGDEIIIDDFKSSKKLYEGEEKESNIQALSYILAAKTLWPDKKPKVRFIFLQFPDNPIMEVKFKESELNGFKYYLEMVQNKIENFTEKDALSNLAAVKDYPKDGGFGGKLICGFSRTKGQLKKNGEIMWGCPMKYGFDYYSVEKNGKILYSVFKKEEAKLREGEVLVKKTFDGCPYFNNKKIMKELNQKSQNVSNKQTDIDPFDFL